jgi:uncharacterized protein YkwD
MIRNLRRLWLLLLLITTASLVQAQSGPSADIVRLVNGVRANLALPPFRYNATLAVAAQQHADWMAATGRYTHYANGTSPQDRANAAGYIGRVSENIVGGTGMTPARGVIWWQNSAVHYATITSGWYSEIGAGHATSADGQNMYVIVVGNPDGQTASSSVGRPAQPSAPIIVTPIPLSTPNPDGSIIHTVGRGQALWTLAAYYEVPLDWLLRVNNLQEGQFVQPGDRLVIRLADGQPTPTPLPTPTPPVVHEVRAGQTLWSIATFHKLSLEELLWLNGISADTVLQPGMSLRVRLLPGEAPPPTATPVTTHTVRAGDTLLGIALRYGLTLEQITALNGISADRVLQIGDEVRIRPPEPEPTATPEPAATATPVPPTPTPSPVSAATPTATPTAVPLPSPQTAEAESADILPPSPAATPLPSPALLIAFGLSGLLLAAFLWWRGDR